MSIFESIREFFLTCPHLKDGVVFINRLDDSNGYSIEATNKKTEVKKYTDGGAVKKLIFYFASREKTSKNLSLMRETSMLYDSVSMWLDEMSSLGNLPALPNGRTAMKIEALGSGHVYNEELGGARYQMLCCLTYYEGGTK